MAPNAVERLGITHSFSIRRDKRQCLSPRLPGDAGVLIRDIDQTRALGDFGWRDGRIGTRKVHVL